VFPAGTIQLVAKKKNGNCQNKIETFLQFLRSVKPPYEKYGQNSMTFLKIIRQVLSSRQLIEKWTKPNLH
jgi:hypothetical protein